jgi:hypothetical protein
VFSAGDDTSGIDVKMERNCNGFIKRFLKFISRIFHSNGDVIIVDKELCVK